MTASVVHGDTGSTRQGWRSLLWLAPLTALWVVLIYWQPTIPASGVPTTAHQLTVHGFIALGLWLGLESTELTPGQRRTTWPAVMIPYTLWFAVGWSAAIIYPLAPLSATVRSHRQARARDVRLIEYLSRPVGVHLYGLQSARNAKRF
jgi:hypothetical protein